MSNFLSCVFCGFGLTTEEPIIEENLNFHDNYEIGDVLGEGGYAIVRKATSKKDDRKVAVKIAKRANIDAKSLMEIRREFDILKSLNHPNIVKALGFYEEVENFYFVLEFMEGGELFDRIVKKTQYNEKEARDAVCSMLSAIEYFHQHDVVHRDLKPENLLLASKEDDANIKIADFGLARVTNGNTITDKAGTPDYIAPEVLQGKPSGKAVDVWAAGVISFVLLGGYAPFHHRNSQTMYDNIAKGNFKFHPQRWSYVSSEAKDFVCSLLIVDPTQRPTASKALQHPWVRKSDELLLESNLTENLEELRKFNGARKLKAGVHAVRGVNILVKLMKSSSSRKSLLSKSREMSESNESINTESSDPTKV